MNDMARSPFGDKAPTIVTVSTEEEALLALDPLLAALRKQSLEASACLSRLRKSRGANDSMTRVARDMADSAKSAFETRMIELRCDPKIMATARRMMRESRAIIRQTEKKAATLRGVRSRLAGERASARGREMEYDEKMNRILSLLESLQAVIDDAQRTLCLASTFAHACDARRKAA